MIGLRSNLHTHDNLFDLGSLTELAISAALQSSAKYHQHGSVLIRNGRVIATSCNDERGHAEYNLLKTVYCLLQKFEGKERG